MCDDYSGYKALFANGVIEAGCMAHARRNFVELHFSNQSTIAATATATAIDFIGQLYGIERQVKDWPPERRREERQRRAASIASALHDWLIGQRTRITDGSATAKAIDYSLNAGLRSPDTSTTRHCRSTKTKASSRSDPGRPAGRTGCSREPSWPVSGRPRSPA